MKNKTVYIIAGANGSGKTTFAKEFIKIPSIAFLNADEIEREFNPDDIEGGKIRAGRIFFKRLHKLIVSKKDFVIESTLSGKSLVSIIKKLKSNDTKIILLYIFLDSIEITIDRVRVRVEEGGHNIPTKDIIRRYPRSINNFWNLYKDFADEWQLFYNGEDNIIQTAFGCKNNYKIIDEEKYKLFKRGFNA
ncbi:MAG: zeta toxin family protein [Candidatus Cloacimonetes bacterium]|nr:zeta toxin family protein [Candidatus Cloacimonadota bacterium]